MASSSGSLPENLSRRLVSFFGNLPERTGIVSITDQILTLYRADRLDVRYPVSTSPRGVGAAEHSGKTPPGFHRIARKIGRNAPPWRIFKSRRDTGRDWRDMPDTGNAVLTRILWLDGLEPGVNNGPGIDTYSRYIYIHGTPHEDRIGHPHSHGCILMRNDDVIDLFNRVRRNDCVLID